MGVWSHARVCMRERAWRGWRARPRMRLEAARDETQRRVKRDERLARLADAAVLRAGGSGGHAGRSVRVLHVLCAQSVWHIRIYTKYLIRYGIYFIGHLAPHRAREGIRVSHDTPLNAQSLTRGYVYFVLIQQDHDSRGADQGHERTERRLAPECRLHGRAETRLETRETRESLQNCTRTRAGRARTELN